MVPAADTHVPEHILPPRPRHPHPVPFKFHEVSSFTRFLGPTLMVVISQHQAPFSPLGGRTPVTVVGDHPG